LAELQGPQIRQNILWNPSAQKIARLSEVASEARGHDGIRDQPQPQARRDDVGERVHLARAASQASL
jgi:hypothetical protein